VDRLSAKERERDRKKAIEEARKGHRDS